MIFSNYIAQKNEKTISPNTEPHGTLLLCDASQGSLPVACLSLWNAVISGMKCSTDNRREMRHEQREDHDGVRSLIVSISKMNVFQSRGPIVQDSSEWPQHSASHPPSTVMPCTTNRPRTCLGTDWTSCPTGSWNRNHTEKSPGLRNARVCYRWVYKNTAYVFICLTSCLKLRLMTPSGWLLPSKNKNKTKTKPATC